MGLRFLERLFGRDPAGREELWQCRPLLVLDENGAVAFFGDAAISFTPTGEDPTVATAKVLSPEASVPELLVNGMRVTGHPDPHMGVRQGRVLWGHDPAGRPYEWRVDRDADDYALTQIHEQIGE